MDGINNHSAGAHDSSIPRLVMDLGFNHIEAWAAASDWDLQLRQLSPGRLNGRVRILTGTHCRSMRVELNQTSHQIGTAPPKHLTFGLPYPTSGDFNWCRAPVRGGEVLNFNQREGFEGTSRESFSGCALSFPREVLENLAKLLDLRVDLDSISRGGGTLLRADAETAHLRAQFDAAYESASQPESTDLAAFSWLFEFGAAETILRLLARAPGRAPERAQPARRCALRQALEILDAPENLPITVAELCKRVGVSAPSLYRAFQDEFGVGTKRYIQSRVLSAVRSELIASTPDTQINDIANAWGIWHMGQFAAAYRRLFGELPSETLRA